MDTIKIESKQTKMVAHRGLSGLERENTCAAFVAAGNRDYFGIETDVHVTSDSQFIIIHDNTTERVTGINLEVEQSTLAQLRELRLTDMDGKVRQDLCLPLWTNICGSAKNMAKACFRAEKLYSRERYCTDAANRQGQY